MTSESRQTPDQTAQGGSEHDQEAAVADETTSTGNDEGSDQSRADGGGELDIERELAEALAQVADLRDQVLRRSADFDNLRRRTQREREELLRYASERVLTDTLEILDDMDRALEHAKDESGPLVEGMRMVQQRLHGMAARHGVVEVECAGQEYDPNVAEALQQIQDPSVPRNTVVQVFQKGYRLHDRLLRPARVVVATGGPERVAEEDAGEASEG